MCISRDKAEIQMKFFQFHFSLVVWKKINGESTFLFYQTLLIKQSDIEKKRKYSTTQLL